MQQESKDSKKKDSKKAQEGNKRAGQSKPDSTATSCDGSSVSDY